MTIPQRKQISIDSHLLSIQITDDGSRTLIDADSGVAFHSAAGAASETQHVYLLNSGIADRLADGEPSSVLEIGLGTGLAMLMTLDSAIASGTPLRYTAIESELLNVDLLGRLHLDRQLSHTDLVDQFLSWRKKLGPIVSAGVHRWQPTKQQSVTIHHGDARAWVGETKERDVYDAIFFDPFAPDTNPELWNVEFLREMYRMLKPGRRLVTYCVNRVVRDSMGNAGFAIRRVPGPPGGKREVLVATKL